ncbi:alpha-protein kinase 2 [Betta splendens]|uniref:non-specific serine/threonine protein kinase n=1 Tax=Betta splendens TaxID=158456 RepID=A0A6P7P051_BETSP|nr:alpha-protein kinase 2 [Betta splendens]
MDRSLLPKHSQTQTSPAPEDSRTGDSRLSLLDSPDEDMLCAHTTGTKVLSNVLKAPDAFHDVSKPHNSTDSDCLKPSAMSCNMSVCPSTLENDFRVCGCLGSLHLLPHLTQNLVSLRPECFSEPYTGSTDTSHSPGATSFISEGLMESSITELLFNHSSSSEHSPPTLLTCPLSLQSEGSLTGPVSELIIFESDTQGFIPKASVAPQEIKCPEYQAVSQTAGEEAGGHSSKNASTCDSPDAVTPHRHDSVKQRKPGDESGMSQYTGLGPPAVGACDVGLMLGSDASQRKAEVTGLSPHPGRSDSPSEVWQDACQYLSGEDVKDQDVLDKRVLAVTQGGLSATSDLTFHPGKTQVSVYNPEAGDWIGWPSEKTRRPPVERWSSVDSWASALSDWAEIISAAPEDVTAACTEIGAEIEALTQALAEADSPAGAEAAVKAQSQTLEETQSGPTSSHRSTDQRRSMGPAEGSESYGADVTPTLSPGSTSPVNQSIPPFDGYVEYLDTDIFLSNGAGAVILNIVEDTDLEAQNAPNRELLEDGRCEVTHGHSVCQQGSGAEQVEAGAQSSPELLFLTADALTLPCVDLQASLHIHATADTLANLDGARQLEPQSGGPGFITPLGPLSFGSSLIRQAADDSEGDRPRPERLRTDNGDLGCDHVQPSAPWPASDGITDRASAEGDEELIHKKENAVESSPEGQCKRRADASLFLPTEQKIAIEDIHELSRELSNLAPVPADHFIISEENHVAFITLELNDPFFFWTPKPRRTDLQFEVDRETVEEMPHKTHKSAESKARSKKDKAGGHHHGPQVSKKPEAPHGSAQHSSNKQDARPHARDDHAPPGPEDRENEAPEPHAAAEAAPSKPQAKKKKKQGQSAAARSPAPADVETPKSAKGRIEMFEAKLGAAAGRAGKERDRADGTGRKSQQTEDKAARGQPPPDCRDPKDAPPKSCGAALQDDVVKRRRLSGDKFGKIVSVLEPKAPETGVCVKAEGDEAEPEAGATRRKAYSDVVKQKAPPPEEPTVVQPIQAAAVSGDAQSLRLWCQFARASCDHTVTWSREGAVLAEVRRSAGDESRASLTISNASHKDLGRYHCSLSSPRGSTSLDFLLTYEVLSEIVVPPSPKTITSTLAPAGSEEEDVHCSSLMFNNDFLSDQYFGENRPVSIVTEKAHFGEGMHRRAFRTTLRAGRIPRLVPGHSCVLKVHNSISYGTKNNDELVRKNFSLAVEECQVQNTAREYIRAYNAVAQSTGAFGDVPEIIPIYLVHRPANDIPYATLEEELIGDFVKYSVKDGKEINLMRRDSEAGQKCCAFQHWVYETTEGNLLVTDMQGVGMRLTDVGIATCKKGYKGFKGNCATSFIDQFKALHQCNRYCEILELTSLQPKAKKPASAPKPKVQACAAPKKKVPGPTVRGKT